MKKILTLQTIAALALTFALLSCSPIDTGGGNDNSGESGIDARIVLSVTAKPTPDEPNETGAMLRWTVNLISGTIDGYRIGVSRDGINFTTVRTVGADVREFHITGLNMGNDYTFRLTPFNQKGDGDSPRIIFRTQSSLLERPIIYAEAQSSSSIRLIWAADYSNSDSSVIIFVRESGSSSESERTLNGRSETVFTGLKRDTEYFFRMAVINRNGSLGTFSETVSAKTRPMAAPQNPTVSLSFDSRLIQICWEAVDGAVGYMVFWDASRTGNFINRAISEITAGNCVNITDFVPDDRGVEIFFRVAAVASDGRIGELSEIAGGDTQWRAVRRTK